MTVRMNGFSAEPESLRAAQLEAVTSVLNSGWYVLGKEVNTFEAAWAREAGTPYVIGVGNGHDALYIGMRSVGIGPGDEVITTPLTAFATTLAILNCGASPVFADVDPATGLLDSESAQRCLSSKTRAVLPVHLYGRACDMDRWADFCAVHNLILLEDCAQSHLSSWRGKPTGSFGRFGAFSFYPTKNLGAPGDAGAIVTADATLADTARRLRNYGQSVRYHHPESGINSRLDEIHAAILSARLPWLRAFTERRKEVARRLMAGIVNPLVRPLPPPEDPGSHVYHLFVVRCERPEALRQWLQQHDIESLIHYPVPAHRQPPAVSCRIDPLGLPTAEAFCASCLSLPCNPQLTDTDVRWIVDAVNSFR